MPEPLKMPVSGPKKRSGLGSRAVSSVLALGFYRLFGGGLSTLLRLLVVSKVLGAAELGVFAASLLFVEALEVLTQSGLRHALVQKKEISKVEVDTVWTFCLVRGVLVSIVCFVGAPVYAGWIGKPECVQYIQVLSVVPVIRGAINIGVVYWDRQVEFGRWGLVQFLAHLAELLVSVSGILWFKSLWAVVVGRIAGVSILFALSFLAYDRRAWFGWSSAAVREMSSFGIWIFAASVTSFLLVRGGDFVTVAFLSSEDVGRYQMAYAIATLPVVEVSRNVNQVVFPAFSSMAGDLERLREASARSMSVLSFFCCAVLAPVGLVGFEVERYLGEDWVPLGWLVLVLVFWGASRALGGAMSTVFQAIGRPRVTVGYQIFMLLLVAVCVPLLSLSFGLLGIAAAFVLSGLVVQVVRSIHLALVLGGGKASVLVPQVVPCAAAGVSVLLLAGAASVENGFFGAPAFAPVVISPMLYVLLVSAGRWVLGDRSRHPVLVVGEAVGMVRWFGR